MYRLGKKFQKFISMKSSKSKHTGKPKAKRQSNPASTGGSGIAFENRVQATRLLAMCLGNGVPGAPDGRISALQFQARIHGHHTDDLVCHIEMNDGRQFRTLLQMKRTLSARANNKAFVECIEAAWTDFNSTNFVSGSDLIFFIYDTASASTMKGASTVCSWARYSASSSEFIMKVDAEGFSNTANRTALSTIKEILESYAKRAINDQELFEFVKHLHCLSHDLDGDNTSEIYNHLNSIRQALALVGEQANSQDIWSSLVMACISANGAAGTITFENLKLHIGEPLNGIFGAARSLFTSPYAVAPTARQSHNEIPANLSNELARLTNMVEMLAHRQPTTQDHLPAARDESVNKLISQQLDGAHSRIKSLRYNDGLEDLLRLSDSHEQFDNHQKARWHLLIATCKWHVQGADAAAEDFLRAAELVKDEDKFAAAGVRGLLLQANAAEAALAGAKAMKAFPESVAVWQVTANARLNLGEKLSLEDVPAELRGDADVLQTLAWSRRREGDISGAVEIALQAVDSNTSSFFTRDTALSICLDHAIGGEICTALHIVNEEEKNNLNRCINEFSPRSERLWSVQSIDAVSTVAANLAIAHLLLAQPTVALNILHEARSHDVSSPHFMRIEIEALIAAGNRDEAMALGRANIDNMPIEALVVFGQLVGETGDMAALNHVIEAAELHHAEQTGLLQNLKGMRWTVLAKSDLPATLDAIRSSDWSSAHSIPELVAGAQVLWTNAFNDEAMEHLQRAVELLPNSNHQGEKYLVAHSLLVMRAYTQAAQIFEQIAPKDKHSQFHTDLLFCYLRTGRRAKAKELIDALPTGWELHADTRHLAMEIGQLAGDWELLAKLVPVEFNQAPTEIRSWLLRVMVAARTSPEDVSAALQNAPLELTGSTQEITQLASLELLHGHKEQAMRRLYVMRRNHLYSTETAAAHIMVLLANSEELPFMEEELNFVGPATSVTLTDKDGGNHVFTLDPTDIPPLPATQEFLKFNSTEASSISGLVVGAELSIREIHGETRVLTVTRICSAYRRLLELSHISLNTPLAPSPIAQVLTVHNEKTGEVDFSQLTHQLQLANEHTKKTIEIYSSAPITLGRLAILLGRDVIDVVRGWSSDGPAIQVSGGNPTERAQVIESLRTGGGTHLIDAVTLVELGQLECLSALETVSNLLVTSQTRDVLEAKLGAAQSERTMGRAFEEEGKLGFIEVTAEHRKREVQLLQTIVDAVHKYCRVVPVYGKDNIPPIVYQLEQVISAEEYSLILASVEHQSTLISLDARLRAIASVINIPGVWPQALMMHARDVGKISGMSYSLATIRQLIANRTFVSVAAEDLTAMAYQGTEWLKLGMSRFTKYIAFGDTEFNSALTVSVDFIQLLAYQGPCHFGALCKILERLVESLFRHKDAPVALPELILREVLQAISLDKNIDPYKIHLQKSILNGCIAAKNAEFAELTDVQVLMCSSPPWLAYAAQISVSEQGENGLINATADAAKPESDAISTSAAESANNPFR
ncbi:tetratricopeptide repeat protein [Comamonas sp. MYb69]|uniref:tetratricopeptide repeat protein n=1 Tax=Comamonas sp. MYb69 TaxID=1848650 RepID=UPI0030A35624